MKLYILWHKWSCKMCLNWISCFFYFLPGMFLMYWRFTEWAQLPIMYDFLPPVNGISAFGKEIGWITLKNTTMNNSKKWRHKDGESHNNSTKQSKVCIKVKMNASIKRKEYQNVFPESDWIPYQPESNPFRLYRLLRILTQDVTVKYLFLLRLYFEIRRVRHVSKKTP